MQLSDYSIYRLTFVIDHLIDRSRAAREQSATGRAVGVSDFQWSLRDVILLGAAAAATSDLSNERRRPHHNAL